MNQPVPDELISAYFDGEVTPEERMRIESLLESSSEFRQLLDDTSKLSALLHSFPREGAPANLATNVQEQVDSIVLPKPPIMAQNLVSQSRFSLRREWTAFGAGMFATMASLLLYVAFHQTQTMTEFHRMADVKTPSSVTFESPPFGENSTGLTREEALGVSRESIAISDSSMNHAFDDAARTSNPASLHAQDAAVLNKANIDDLTPTNSMNGVSAGEKLAEVSQNRLYNMTVEPEHTQDFLSSLKNGDIIQRNIVDPDSAVAVGEFTVVDIDRGAREIKLLLEKRDVQQLEDGDVLSRGIKSNALAFDAFASPSRDQSASTDNYVVIYARAQGDQLADTISESLKDHPDLYKKFEARTLIDLPMNTADSTDFFSKPVSDPITENPQSTWQDANSVSADANRAVTYFALSNGLTVEIPTDGQRAKQIPSGLTDLASDKKEGVGAKDDGKKSDLAITGATEGADRSRALRQDDQSPKKVPTEISMGRIPGKQADEAVNASQGFAAFRVGPESVRASEPQPSGSQQQPIGQQQRVGLQQQIASKRIMALPYNYNANVASNSATLSTNNGNGGIFNNAAGVQGANFRNRSNRATADNRDPRLVRMLIVLKSEMPTPAAKP